ncbi:UNVERIFIED_CONTAM: hypothetical protein FKN15_055279 [Acipenser sinensis]
MLSKQVLLFALVVGLRAQETQPSERDSPRSFSVTYSIDSQPPRPVEQGGINAPEMSTLWLGCAVQSNPQSSVSWLIESISTGDFKSTTNGSDLLIDGVRVEDEGTYWCMANNSNGAGNSSVAVRVQHKAEKQEVVFSEVRFVMGTPQPKARCQLPTKDLGSEDSSQTNTVCALVNLSNGPDRE